MKAVTEFQGFTLYKALQAKNSLTAEGKTPEEVQTNLGQSYKFEGEKLGYFMHSLEVASANPQNLKRVIIAKIEEGEKTPANAVKIEELHFIPEFLILSKAAAHSTHQKGGRSGVGRGGKKSGGPKGSPWGLSPEEKQAKNKKPVPS